MESPSLVPALPAASISEPSPGATGIETRIYTIRGVRVMLDRDLATLYDVETRALNQAVRRHASRFPPDFMFQLTPAELTEWKSQRVMSNRERMGLRRRPLAFTEYGVAMLSSVLTSERAAQVNVAIMRGFGRLRALVLSHADLARRVDELEARYDQQFADVFAAIREMMAAPPSLPEEPPRRSIGFHALGPDTPRARRRSRAD